jgi:uncharacterized membrane protein YeaQ/YmgE (transglycosylase-associated protein family)
MTLPTLILGFVISTLYGALFHLFRGGGPARLLFYLCLGWAGFWIGQISATRLSWTFAKFGPIHLGAATLGSLIFLLVGHWLSLVKVEKR